ncbi:zinc finger protein [Crotalus adamanteus]|uniref:Zinc finger protein n=1 Tax=Crotalus adamanteus TaxID=8729 RepID=A0AAW1B1Q2_CROAD
MEGGRKEGREKGREEGTEEETGRVEGRNGGRVGGREKGRKEGTGEGGREEQRKEGTGRKEWRVGGREGKREGGRKEQRKEETGRVGRREEGKNRGMDPQICPSPAQAPLTQCPPPSRPASQSALPAHLLRDPGDRSGTPGPNMSETWLQQPPPPQQPSHHGATAALPEHPIPPSAVTENPLGCAVYGILLQLEPSGLQHPPLSASGGGETSPKCGVCGHDLSHLSNPQEHQCLQGEAYLFHCNVCELHFKESSELLQHPCTPSGEQPFCCVACHKAFLQPSDLRQHECTHSTERPFQCDLCQMSFKQQYVLMRHCHTHKAVAPAPSLEQEASLPPFKCSLSSPLSCCATAEWPFKCMACSKAYKRASALQKHHLASHCAEKPLCCTLCEWHFFSSSEFVQHCCDPAREQPLKCPDCCATAEQPFKCMACSKAYKRASALQKHHLASHCAEKPLCCTLCEWHFFSSSEFVQHRCDPAREQPLKCPDCCATAEQPFKCMACSKAYNWSSALQKHHLASHCAEKPLRCTLCEWRFFSSSEFVQHRCDPAREQPLKCPDCCATAEQPFKCMACSKAYNWASALQKHHLASHCAKKPLRCTLCEWHFFSSSEFVQHCCDPARERPLKCPDCQKRFKVPTTIRDTAARDVTAPQGPRSTAHGTKDPATGEALIGVTRSNLLTGATVMIAPDNKTTMTALKDALATEA